MLKNRALRLQVVKTTPERDGSPTRPLINSEEVAEIATTTAYWTKRAALGVAVLYTGKKVVDTSAEVALIIARSTIK